MKFGGASDTYIRYNSGIEMTVGGNIALTATSSGGTLSGAWSSETTISTSDRRLKKDIEPLEDVLKGLSPSEEGVNWVLRELRPVAFRFKRGAEAKHLRLGFIAQEVEDVLPMLSRAISDEPDAKKGLVLTDLIAVLVSHARTTQEKLAAYEEELRFLRERVALLERDVKVSKQQVATLNEQGAHFEARLAGLQAPTEQIAALARRLAALEGATAPQ